MPHLDLEQIATALRQLGGWQYESGALTKEWTFTNFREAMAFTNTIAELAEDADHHPDIAVNYNHVRLTLSTHSEGGVTTKDVELAKKIEGQGIGARERRGGDRRLGDRRENDRRQTDRRTGSRRKPS